MNIKESLVSFGLERMVDQIYKDPQTALPKVMDWADRFSGGLYEPHRKKFRSIINDPQDPYYGMIRKVFTDLDRSTVKKLLINFFVHANLAGWKVQDENRKKYNCNIPWAILLDPTSACNMKCTGCWAAEYGNHLNLSLETIDSIIRQGKELGTYMYIYTGGEPLVRKKDLIKICEMHPDCSFLSFTNGTLIDEEFCQEMLFAYKGSLAKDCSPGDDGGGIRNDRRKQS